MSANRHERPLFVYSIVGNLLVILSPPLAASFYLGEKLLHYFRTFHYLIVEYFVSLPFELLMDIIRQVFDI